MRLLWEFRSSMMQLCTMIRKQSINKIKTRKIRNKMTNLRRKIKILVIKNQARISLDLFLLGIHLVCSSLT